MVWVKRRDDLHNILAFGTALGYLVLWRQTVCTTSEKVFVADQSQDHDIFEECYSRRVAHGQELTCLSWDSSNEVTLRLASGTRDQCIQLWSFNGKELHSIWSIQLTSTVPKTIGFSENPGADLYVFGIYNGQWHILAGEDGSVKCSNDLNKVM
jgi:WD domain, G-beta repeat.